MPPDGENLKLANRTLKTRKGHEMVTPETGRSREAGGDHSPHGPHKKWAVFVEQVRQELGWTLEETCEFCDVAIGWLKKARDGQNIRGAFREKLQDAFDKKWKETFPNKSPLVWPDWIDAAPWSMAGGVAAFVPVYRPTAVFDPRFVPQDSADARSLCDCITQMWPAVRTDLATAVQRAERIGNATGNTGKLAEVLAVEALLCLEQHADELGEHRQDLLDTAARWTLNPELTWNVRFRSFVLVAALAAAPPLRHAYNWRPHLGEAIDGGVDARSGVCWLLPVAILYGADNTSNALSDASTKYRQFYEPSVREHQVLTFCEGLRTCLVKARERRDNLTDCIPCRADRAFRWIDFSHCEQLQTLRDEHELRVLLAYANLLQCAKVFSTMGVANYAADIDKALRTLKKRFKTSAVKLVAHVVSQRASEVNEPWHVEGACLHRLSDWDTGGKLAPLAPVFTQFFEVLLDRKKRSGAGWQSQVEIMGTFGRVCPVPRIRELADGMSTIPAD